MNQTNDPTEEVRGSKEQRGVRHAGVRASLLGDMAFLGSSFQFNNTPLHLKESRVLFY